MRDFNMLKCAKMKDFNPLKYARMRDFNGLKYREYPAYRDERKRHISASKNGGSILTTVPERALEPILLSINFVMVRPILWP